jgi:hypothetical protein
MDAYQLAAFNSLIRPEESLFLKSFSLLIRVGKYLKSACGTEVFATDIVSVTPKPRISL